MFFLAEKEGEENKIEEKRRKVINVKLEDLPTGGNKDLIISQNILCLKKSILSCNFFSIR